eukprot:3496-Heterococcus_DN1.PRE.2
MAAVFHWNLHASNTSKASELSFRSSRREVLIAYEHHTNTIGARLSMVSPDTCHFSPTLRRARSSA